MALTYSGSDVLNFDLPDAFVCSFYPNGSLYIHRRDGSNIRHVGFAMHKGSGLDPIYAAEKYENVLIYGDYGTFFSAGCIFILNHHSDGERSLRVYDEYVDEVEDRLLVTAKLYERSEQ